MSVVVARKSWRGQDRWLPVRWGIEMAGDLGVFDDATHTYVRGGSKVLAVGSRSILGLVGSAQWTHALAVADWPQDLRSDAPERDVCRALGAAVEQAMRGVEIRHPDEAAIWAYYERMFMISWPLGVFEVNAPAVAIGSGSAVAEGIMLADPTLCAGSVVALASGRATYVRGVGPTLWSVR